MKVSGDTPSQWGFSLIELLLVLAVIAILVGIAAGRLPRDRLAVNQATEGLSGDYQFARFEAIRRNEFVGVSVDPDSDAYVVFVDMNRDLVLSSGDPAVKTVDLSGEGIVIASTNLGPLVFDPRGLNPTPFANELEVVIDTRARTFPRTVCVTSQGRSRVHAGSGCAS